MHLSVIHANPTIETPKTESVDLATCRLNKLCITEALELWASLTVEQRVELIETRRDYCTTAMEDIAHELNILDYFSRKVGQKT